MLPSVLFVAMQGSSVVSFCLCFDFVDPLYDRLGFLPCRCVALAGAPGTRLENLSVEMEELVVVGLVPLLYFVGAGV